MYRVKIGKYFFICLKNVHMKISLTSKSLWKRRWGKMSNELWFDLWEECGFYHFLMENLILYILIPYKEKWFNVTSCNTQLAISLLLFNDSCSHKVNSQQKAEYILNNYFFPSRIFAFWLHELLIWVVSKFCLT